MYEGRRYKVGVAGMVKRVSSTIVVFTQVSQALFLENSPRGLPLVPRLSISEFPKRNPTPRRQLKGKPLFSPSW